MRSARPSPVPWMGLTTALSAFACEPGDTSSDTGASADVAPDLEDAAGPRTDAGFVCPPDGIVGRGRHR